MTPARHPAFEDCKRVRATDELRRRGLARIAGDRVVRGKASPCPSCGKASGAFSSFQNGRRLKCHSCGDSWDAIALVRMLDGVDALTAARVLLGYPADGSADPVGWPTHNTTETAGVPQPRAVALSPHTEPRPPTLSRLPECEGYRFTPFGWQLERDLLERLDARREAAAARAYTAWRAGVMAHGLFAATGNRRRLTNWFEARFLDPDLLPDALAHLTESASMIYGYAPRDGRPSGFHTSSVSLNGKASIVLAAPAMLARIDPPPGHAGGGLHATYLSDDGRSKVGHPGRKMWAGADGARGGVWLTDQDPDLGPLFVAEGIETALSLLMEYRLRHPGQGRALAVLSLDNLQGAVSRDHFGRWRLDPLEADLSRPAVTWPQMGDVVIGPDHDMKPLRVKIRGGQTELDATARMELSARLAVAAWRRAGARSVRVIRPPLGMDFNDARRRSALGYFKTGEAA